MVDGGGGGEIGGREKRAKGGRRRGQLYIYIYIRIARDRLGGYLQVQRGGWRERGELYTGGEEGVGG